MKYTELKDKDVNALKTLLKGKQLELFALKAKHKTMQLQNTSELKKAKKDIARVNSAIGNFKRSKNDS